MRKIKEGQSNKEILKIKTAARSLSTGTQQLYAKGKEEMEKKKNRRFGNYYSWQLKIFPQTMQMLFHTCMHISG